MDRGAPPMKGALAPRTARAAFSQPWTPSWARLSSETPFVSFLYTGKTGSLLATAMSWVSYVLGTAGSLPLRRGLSNGRDRRQDCWGQMLRNP